MTFTVQRSLPSYADRIYCVINKYAKYYTITSLKPLIDSEFFFFFLSENSFLTQKIDSLFLSRLKHEVDTLN